MNTSRLPVVLRRFSSALLAGAFTFGFLEAAMALPAQEPLFMTARADPNIMYIMDDSGSMQFETMPGEEFEFGYSRDIRFVFPRIYNLYGEGNNYNSYVATVDSHIFNYRARSPQINKLYYNPSITYTPWTKHDGTLYPKASPSRAYHHPENTARGYRNLTVQNDNTDTGDSSVNSYVHRWVACTGPEESKCSDDYAPDVNKTFWPATYYWYSGTDAWNTSNFAKVEIKSGTSTYSGHGRKNRTDCADAANGNCSYDEEIQNFANWYSYYRSRTLAARAGIGKAFAEQGASMRVGYGAINKSSASLDGVSTGTIVKGVRQFGGDDRKEFFRLLYESEVPAAGTPLRAALDDAGQYFSRTDDQGPWGAAPGTNDSTAQLECRQSYSVLMTDGYWSGSGAGTAAAKENNDGTAGETITGPDGESYVFAAGTDPFADTHVNTLADVAMYYWKRDLRPNLGNKVPTSDINPAFWQHMVTFGVGLGVSGTIDPDTAFQAIDTGANINWPSPTTGDKQKIDDLLHASVNSRGGFFSSANPESFADELSSVLQNIISRGIGSASAVATNSTRLTEGSILYQARFNSKQWSGEILAYDFDEKGELKGQPISTNTTLTSGTIDSSSRRVYTYTGDSVPTPFQWSQLTSEQQAHLGGGDAVLGQARVQWLRGASVDGMRVREKTGNHERLLGDIVNSSPTYLGGRDMRYDRLPGDAGEKYRAWLQNTKRKRAPMLFVGANDGMLHAFNADTLEEVFAYVPAGVYPKLANLTKPGYGQAGSGNPHQFSVNGPLAIGDAYLDGGWKTIVVGTLGAGGKGIFALDVSGTTPRVLFELNNMDGSLPLGFVMGQPYIVPLKSNDADGVRWAVVFGNGYEAGSTRLYWIDLEHPSSINTITAAEPGTGLSAPALLPNGEGVVEAAYAGDLDGNLWKFDLYDTNSSKWAASKLFTATTNTGAPQPITGAPELGVNSQKEYAVMVYFGTGRYIYGTDNTANIPTQTFYAVIDNGTTVDRASLHEKKVGLSNGNRSINNNDVDWSTSNGWRLDLPTKGERVIVKPILLHDKLVFVTLIPSDVPCDYGGNSWIMEVTAIGDKYVNHTVLGENVFNEFLVLGEIGLGLLNPPGDSGDEGDGGGGGGDPSCPKGTFPARIYALGSDGQLYGVNTCLDGGTLGRQSWRQLK